MRGCGVVECVSGHPGRMARCRAPAGRNVGDFPREFSIFFEGPVGVAGGHSGSVKIFFDFLVRTQPGLRRGRPGFGAPSAHGQDAGRPRGVMG